MKKIITLSTLTGIFLFAGTVSPAAAGNDLSNLPEAPQWEEIEIVLSSDREYENPYTNVDILIVFSGPKGLELKRPAFWLVSADGTGRERLTEPAGIVTFEWDAYGQPTGIHYSLFCDRLANWSDDLQHGFHYNRTHHDAEWLDFQWAQTGHGGEHLPYKVFNMYDNLPVKASANDEPTYEQISRPDNATGWWQGHEAWINITSGGTMGHVYGAGGLWNWKLAADEPGWADWANTHAVWYESIEFVGSKYVGYVSGAFEGLDFADIERRHDLTVGHPALAREGKLYIVYLQEGGQVRLEGLSGPLRYRWFGTKTGRWVAEGMVSPRDQLAAPGKDPWVLIADSVTN
jgi:hypothetical protein